MFATAQVPREYVHKTAESEVLLTGCRAIGPDAFHITARWPVDHGFYRPVHGLFDPLLGAESIRQAVPLLSHVAYDVPFGSKQSWHTYAQILDPALLTSGATAADIDLYVSCSDVVRRAGRLVSLTMKVDLVRDGLPLGEAELSFRNHAPAIYQRLRGPYADIDAAVAGALPLAPPVSPERVAREQLTDVVLSATDSPSRSQLRVDLSHPVLFDHPVDHVPGMLLLEAARQAAHKAAHPAPTVAVGLEAVFSRYVELDAVCLLRAHTAPAAADRQSVRVDAEQNGELQFTATITLARAS